MKSETKLDLYKLHRADYAATGKPAFVTVRKAAYLAIDGQGAPGGPIFEENIGALYGVAFTIKMTRKFDGREDYVVCKLEGQWWSENGNTDFSHLPKDQWLWTLLIRTPDFIKEKDLQQSVATLLKKGKSETVKNVRLITLEEGRCLQMLHVGPYEQERETIDLMKAFADKAGLRFHGRHHEVYLSDPRRVAPEKLKTILRMPVTK